MLRARPGMKRQLKVLSAITVATLAVLVVLMRLGPGEDSRSSAKAQQQLKARQAKRFEETREARLADLQTREHDLKLAQLKAQLLAEFPNLRADPPIPNEENSIYLFDELVADLLREGSTFRPELEALMGKDAEWNLEATQAFLKRYDWVFDRLSEVATTPSGDSYHYEKPADRPWHPDAPLLIMDLLRLEIRATEASANRNHAPALEAFWAQLAERITGAEGAPFMNHLMVDAALDMPSDAPMDEKTYQQFSFGGLYGGAMMGWLEPNWAATLSPEALSREIRRTWWDTISGDLDDPFSSLFASNHPEGARVYSKHVSEVVARLEQESLKEFFNRGTGMIDVSGLPENQRMETLNQEMRFHRQLTDIIATAQSQNLQWMLMKMRRAEQAGEAITADFFKYKLRDPVTGEPWSYDADTRILTLPEQPAVLRTSVIHPVRVKVKTTDDGSILSMVEFLDPPDADE